MDYFQSSLILDILTVNTASGKRINMENILGFKKQDQETVLVTGANSFIGSHIVRLLLEQGYQVRATVNSLHDQPVVQALEGLVKHPKHKLRLYEIDAFQVDSWGEPLRGCSYIIYSASPYPDEAFFGNEINTVDLSINAISTFAEACVKYCLGLRRLVYTSSISAVAGDAFQDGRTYSENDWPEDFQELQPYIKSKVVSEKYLWDFLKEKAEAKQATFELAVVNPGFVLVSLDMKSKLSILNH